MPPWEVPLLLARAPEHEAGNRSKDHMVIKNQSVPSSFTEHHQYLFSLNNLMHFLSMKSTAPVDDCEVPICSIDALRNRVLSTCCLCEIFAAHLQARVLHMWQSLTITIAMNSCEVDVWTCECVRRWHSHVRLIPNSSWQTKVHVLQLHNIMQTH